MPKYAVSHMYMYALKNNYYMQYTVYVFNQTVN